VIVIDPGHGGADPGTVGLQGTLEKTITLLFSRELKNKLEATGRYSVVLTRSGDTFQRLRDRVEIARRAKGDLFLSVHADSLPDPTVRGASVYTLSDQASDQAAEALAAKENKADVIAGVDLTNENPLVASILIDLAQRETMNLSATFARHLVEEMAEPARILRKSHRFAGFAVLKAPDVPSVLVELGYLSNPDEERLLLQGEYRRRLAEAVARAIDRWFAEGSGNRTLSR
jgi:N-acetylmuramoyl-L-alanine amidase